MYNIRGLRFSFNTTKIIYTAEMIGIKYDYREMDLSKGEHKAAEHLAIHPLGKVPTLTHNDQHIFESNVICRYLASVENSSLYPQDDLIARSNIDQWIDLFSIHLGRWLGNLLFERVVKEKFSMGTPDTKVIEEALGFAQDQMKAVDNHLEGRTYFIGDTITLADLCALAYIETTTMSGFSLAAYPSVGSWLKRIEGIDAIQRARETTLKSPTS